MITVGQYETGIELELEQDEMRCPVMVLGLPRHGKSVLLGNLALQLNAADEGVLVIDVKDGLLAEDIAARADPDRLIYIRLGKNVFDGRMYHWGLNPIEIHDRDRVSVENIVVNALAMFERLAEADLEVMQQFRRFLNLALRTIMYDDDPNMVKVRMILTEPVYRLRFLEPYRSGRLHMNQELVKEWDRFESKDHPASARTSEVNSVMNRLFNMLAPESLKYLLINKTSIHLEEWLEDGKLVVVDCATDIVWDQREDYASLILAIAMNYLFSRRHQPGMRTIRLVCDEFHKYAGANFSAMLDQGQVSGVYPMMAHQNLGQLEVTSGKKNTVANSTTGIPISFFLKMTAADIKASKDIIDPEVIELIRSLKKYEAVLSMHDEVPGLLDPAPFAKIGLNDWLVEADPTQLARAVERQRPGLTAETILREKIATYEVLGSTGKPNRNAGSAEPVRQADDGPDRPTFIRGSTRSARRPAAES